MTAEGSSESKGIISKPNLEQTGVFYRSIAAVMAICSETASSNSDKPDGTESGTKEKK